MLLIYFGEKLHTQEEYLYYCDMCYYKFYTINFCYANIKHQLTRLLLHTNNITDTPLHYIVYVQKGYTVNNLVDIWN